MSPWGRSAQHRKPFLRLGGGQLPLQEEGSGPGEEVDRLEAEFEPGGVDRNAAGGTEALDDFFAHFETLADDEGALVYAGGLDAVYPLSR